MTPNEKYGNKGTAQKCAFLSDRLSLFVPCLFIFTFNDKCLWYLKLTHIITSFQDYLLLEMYCKIHNMCLKNVFVLSGLQTFRVYWHDVLTLD